MALLQPASSAFRERRSACACQAPPPARSTSSTLRAWRHDARGDVLSRKRRNADLLPRERPTQRLGLAGSASPSKWRTWTAALAALEGEGRSDCAWGPMKRPDYARAEIRDPDGNPDRAAAVVSGASRAAAAEAEERRRRGRACAVEASAPFSQAPAGVAPHAEIEPQRPRQQHERREQPDPSFVSARARAPARRARAAAARIRSA